MNILLTGGRAPATLDLARAFHRAGHTVFMAESLRGHLSEPSNSIKKNFLVPRPRQHAKDFVQAIQKIIRDNEIDLLIPTCEEVFYVSMGRAEFPCAVFSEPLEKLERLHNKWAFALLAEDKELPIPETFLIRTTGELLMAFAQWPAVVMKPVYSRFASRTLIRPTIKRALSTLALDPDSAWIAQPCIEGRQICTYSVCQSGQITAHTAYPSTFTAGRGATIVFQHIHHPGIFEWVRAFVEANHFTGQIAFDFIETANGEIFALECNPRATSGIHLLVSSPQFPEAFLNPKMQILTPSSTESHMLATAMAVYGLPSTIRKRQLGRWFKTIFSSNDVIFDANDPRPFLLQFRSIFSYLRLARQHKISALEASTFDIEWNGEDVLYS